jgi:hypothetical protein
MMTTVASCQGVLTMDLVSIRRELYVIIIFKQVLYLTPTLLCTRNAFVNTYNSVLFT